MECFSRLHTLILTLTLGVLVATKEGLSSFEEVPTVLEATLKIIRNDVNTSDLSVDEFRTCLPEEATTAFAQRVQSGIDKMMRKRRKQMRLGLQDLASAAGGLAEDAEARCTKLGSQASLLISLSRVLKRYTQSKQFIDYEKLQSLKVGGVDIHKPLNRFIGSWKKQPADAGEVGQKLGEVLILFNASMAEHNARKQEL